jgi:hypothetical protein
MHFQERLLKEVVGFGPVRGEAQAEAVQRSREAVVHRFENAVVPVRIALHQAAQRVGIPFHASQVNKRYAPFYYRVHAINTSQVDCGDIRCHRARLASYWAAYDWR